MSIKNNKSLFTILGIFLLGFFVFLGVVPAAKATGGEWEGVGLGEGEFLAENGIFSSIAFHPGTNEPYVVYADENEPGKATVKKYDGASWSVVGEPGFTAGAAYGTVISFNPRTNEPYVFYGDGSDHYKGTVKKYDGSSWVNVGSPFFSAGSIASELKSSKVAFHPATNESYVAYSDGGSDYKAVVKKFDGSSWVNVGPAQISSAAAYPVCLVFNPDTSEPYIAFSDSAGHNLSVKKFNGTSWENVGSGFGENTPILFSLALHPETNEPYVAYFEAIGNQKAVVKKFNGSSWVNVGDPFFSSGEATYIDIAFCPSTNEPIVAYADDSLYYKAVAKKFNGSSWVDAGTIGRDSGDPYILDMVFNPKTNEPYVTYTDYIGEPESSYRIAVKKFNKLLTDTPTLTYNSSKKAKKKITYNFQDLNLKIKKKDIKIRLNGKKINMSRVSKRGNNVLAAINLKYGKWAKGNYNLTMTYKGKRGKTTYRGTWKANNVLSIN